MQAIRTAGKLREVEAPGHICLQGQYDEEKDFGSLNARLEQLESKRKKADRIFYLSIPPTIFTVVAANASVAASSKCAQIHKKRNAAILCSLCSDAIPRCLTRRPVWPAEVVCVFQEEPGVRFAACTRRCRTSCIPIMSRLWPALYS